MISHIKFPVICPCNLTTFFLRFKLLFFFIWQNYVFNSPFQKFETLFMILKKLKKFVIQQTSVKKDQWMSLIKLVRLIDFCFRHHVETTQKIPVLRIRILNNLNVLWRWTKFRSDRKQNNNDENRIYHTKKNLYFILHIKLWFNML